MADLPFSGRYKLYKAGTSKLVNWLANTASRCCDLKKLAKIGGKLPSAPKSSSSTKKATDISINTRELLELASAIANADPPQGVPLHIITIAKDVISGREQCAQWYAAQAVSGNSSILKENASHQHFIDILRKIVNLLETMTKDDDSPSNGIRPVKKAKQPQVQQHESDSLSNLFDLLELEEPAALPLGNAPKHATKVATAPRLPRFKLENEGKEPAFATWCFLQDLYDVRCFAKDTWAQYARGDISFLVASSITDVAFGLLRRAEEAFLLDGQGCETTQPIELCEFLGLTSFQTSCTVWLCPAVHGTSPTLSDSNVNIVELLCPIAQHTLLIARDDARDYCQAEQGKGPKAETCSVEGKSLLHEFSCVLFTLMKEIHEASHLSMCSHAVLDEFVQGLGLLHTKNKSPMWLVVACQIYLDIYDLLGTHIRHGVESIQCILNTHTQIGRDIAEFHEETGDRFGDVWDAIHKLEWVVSTGNRFEHDHWDGCVCSAGRCQALFTELKAGKAPSATPMEQHLPGHAGAVLLDLKLGLLSAGCSIGNHDSVVLSIAHLYKALRAAGLLKSDWTDLDFVLQSFRQRGRKPLFSKLGSQYDGETAQRHYLLDLGVSIGSFARDARHNSVANIKEPAKMIIPSAFLGELSNRQAQWRAEGCFTSKSKSVETVLHALSASSYSESANNRAQDSHLKQLYTPVQLLSTFKASMLKDESILNFDFTGFTVSCLRLFMSVRAEAQTERAAVHDKSLTSTISRLLRYLTTSRCTSQIASIFEKHISARGKMYTKQAFDQSSGRIPKALRPHIEQRYAEQQESRNLSSMLLQCTSTRIMTSGYAMAAYHPGVQKTCIQPCCKDYNKPEDERETHPAPGGILHYGAALPACVLQEVSEAMKKTPAKVLVVVNKYLSKLFDMFSEGHLPVGELRNQVETLTGFKLEEDKSSATRGIAWSYVMPPTAFMYEVFFWLIAVGHISRSQGLHGQSITVAVDVVKEAIKGFEES